MPGSDGKARLFPGEGRATSDPYLLGLGGPALEAEPFLKSPKNPFSRNGALTRFAEHVPIVNNAVQGLHYMAGNQDAYQRARRRNPLRSDGYVVGAAERIPVVNNVVQGVHLARGRVEDLQRARERNPLGHAGYVTQAVEHVPVVADAIRCIHMFRGLQEDAERARAYSLRKLVGKHGAITKLAELLPGTNLLAAAVLELSGDRAEAQKALNLLKQYRDVAGADGALAKLAELFPGTDVIAFGLQVNGGHYASALRAICKTRWVDIKSKSTYLWIAMGRSKDWAVLDVESDLELRPKAYSLAGGLLDLGIHILDFNRHGEPRWHMRSPSRTKGEAVRRISVRGSVQDAKVLKANEELQGLLAYLTEQAPEYCGWGVDLANWAFAEWVPSTSRSRAIMRGLYVLFPPMPFSPPPGESHGARLAKAIQDSLPEFTAGHEPMPLNPAHFQIPVRRVREGEHEPGWPEAAAAASCLSLAGCIGLGLHTGPLACLAGCGAGLGALHRQVKRNLLPWLNRSNAAVWEWMSAPVIPSASSPKGTSPPGPRTPPFTQRSASSASGATAQDEAKPAGSPEGVVCSWPAALLEDLVGTLVRDYIVEEFCTLGRPRNWLHPMCLVLGLFERQLRTFLDDACDGQAVPLGIPIPLPEGMYNGAQIWLPEIRVMLVLWLRFKEDRRYVTAVKVALVDGMIDSIANAVRSQCLPSDLRDFDPRLADFTEPVDLKVNIALNWVEGNRLRLELNDISMKLHLPQ